MTDLIAKARAVLNREADQALILYIHDLLTCGDAEWSVDPYNEGVVGLLDTRGDGFAYIVLYRDEDGEWDWEVDEHTEIDLYSID